MAKLKPYAAKYTRTSTGYMGQLVEWPEVIAEGKTLEECWAMLQDALAEMILAYHQQHKEIPKNQIKWWAQYPKVEWRVWRQPGPDDQPDPRLQPGTPVRLKGKPDRVRRVLNLNTGGTGFAINTSTSSKQTLSLASSHTGLPNN